MTLKEHIRKNVVLALPVVVGQLGHIMVTVADSVSFHLLQQPLLAPFIMFCCSLVSELATQLLP